MKQSKNRNKLLQNFKKVELNYSQLGYTKGGCCDEPPHDPPPPPGTKATNGG